MELKKIETIAFFPLQSNLEFGKIASFSYNLKTSKLANLENTLFAATSLSSLSILSIINILTN